MEKHDFIKTAGSQLHYSIVQEAKNWVNFHRISLKRASCGWYWLGKKTQISVADPGSICCRQERSRQFWPKSCSTCRGWNIQNNVRTLGFTAEAAELRDAARVLSLSHSLQSFIFGDFAAPGLAVEKLQPPSRAKGVSQNSFYHSVGGSRKR